MKRFFLGSIACMFILSTFGQTATKLPDPQPLKSSKMTLMQALQQRHSVREYADKGIGDNTLSTLLWAACGINRPADRRITAPSAINAQDIVVYVCKADGYYRYEADGHKLVKMGSTDLRPAVAGRQDFAKTAPVCLMLVSDLTKFRNPSRSREFGAVDAGYVSQNICLACTALGLATVPRASMDKETLAQALQLGENQLLLLNHPVGWPK